MAWGRCLLCGSFSGESNVSQKVSTFNDKEGKSAALAPLPRKESKAAYSRKLFFFCCSLAKLCFELNVVNGTPWVDDMAHAGLIQKYHSELLRKDTNSLASHFNSNTRANVLWLGIGRGNLTGCHRQ